VNFLGSGMPVTSIFSGGPHDGISSSCRGCGSGNPVLLEKDMRLLFLSLVLALLSGCEGQVGDRPPLYTGRLPAMWGDGEIHWTAPDKKGNIDMIYQVWGDTTAPYGYRIYRGTLHPERELDSQ
jgi:hypothetical protein